MEKVIYVVAGLAVGKIALTLYQHFSTPQLNKPSENKNISALTKKIQDIKRKLSKHKDNRSTSDVENYYNDNSDK